MKRVWPLDELIEQFTLLPNEAHEQHWNRKWR
jgi:hypothetical protein